MEKTLICKTQSSHHILIVCVFMITDKVKTKGEGSLREVGGVGVTKDKDLKFNNWH